MLKSRLNMSEWKSSIGWLATLGVVFTSVGHSSASAGDSKNFRFQKAPVNSMGVKSMAELRGKPVLIDFWGTR